jgi:hypothetical protein
VQSGGSVQHAKHVTQHLDIGASGMIDFLMVFFALSGMAAWGFAIFVICFIYLEK